MSNIMSNMKKKGGLAKHLKLTLLSPAETFPTLEKISTPWKGLLSNLGKHFFFFPVSDSQKKAVLEFQVSTRYLQPLLQALFDEDDILFKWTNEACFNDADNDLQDHPDGCIENDDLTIDYLEVKPIDKAKDHNKINTDLYRLGVFSKAATTKYKLKHIFQVMAVGTNLQFHISELKGNVLTMVELDHFRLPLSMDELPQLIPYLHRLYNVVATTYSCCYKQKKLNGDMPSGSSLEPRVIKAITVKTSDRTRKNYLYHPYH
ncbi:hypothetical protein K501DRAFT_304696 [Backusella circina FSU 941]|nr:hypothetical protein K501DRAFT_304696 [Backusella circina FSU 941]